MPKYLFVFLFSVFFHLHGMAQKAPKKFSKESEAYLTQVEELLEDQKKEEGILLAQKYRQWFIGLSAERQENLIDISNNFLKKRVLDYSEWLMFIEIIININQEQDPSYFDPFAVDLKNYSRKNSGRITSDYLRMLYGGLTKSELYNDDKLLWKLDGELKFVMGDQPQFTFENGSILGYFKGDSTIIQTTTGILIPKRRRVEAKGGVVYFRRAGLSEDTAYVELMKYEIEVNKPGFQADSTTLYTQLYIKEPVMGSFEEKLSTKTEEEEALFPKFTSYRSDLVVEEFLPGMDYEGGISIIGGRIFGSGVPQKKAQLNFKYEGNPFLFIKSERFWLRGTILSALDAAIKIKLDEDSIYHPKSDFKYFVNEQLLTLIRTDEGLSLAPYANTYHDLDMYFEVLNWKMGAPQFHLGNQNMGSTSPVYFESLNYYRGEKLAELQGLSEVNPVYHLARIADIFGRNVTVKTLSYELGMSEINTQRFVMFMTIKGFTEYNQEKEEVYIKDKVYDYINNYEEKRDYDVIRFISSLNRGANATISLESKKLEIRGISAIALSDSQKVAMYPYGRKITVHEGLDFDFDGRVNAGRFTFWGNQFFFDYDQFKVNMNDIDSMRFKIKSFTKDVNGNRKLVQVKNVLQDINGELLIDHPNNKSGKVTFHEYPYFRSGKESYVYYDRPEVFNRVYDRERFYVELVPFEIDSLDNTSTDGLKFSGTFVSAGIFPDMVQDISVQEDYSLGFKASTPVGGFQAYGGKGVVEADLSLSNKGFIGNGTLSYLKSTSISDKFYYFPDSTKGLAQSYELQPQLGGVEYPHAIAADAKILWEPYLDVLFTTNTTSPLQLYDEIGMEMRGTLALKPTLLGGKGRLDFLDAQTDSKDYLFKNKMFSSNTLDFRVRAHAEAKWGFEMGNANGFVDFTQERGEFKMNDPAKYLEFPINQYAALMDFAEWRIPEKSLEVKKMGKGALSDMVSYHRKQDSLRFNAGYAKFYLLTSLLEGFDVPHMDVADARIFPDSGYVAIDSAANMRRLEKALLTANRDTKFHNFTNASLKVRGRHNYSGNGEYEYVDMDGVTWPLYFDEIKVDTSETTIAKASVKAEDQFYLSPFFAYYGKVNLRAPERHMYYDGYTLIQQVCDNIETTWFKFKSQIDPKFIIIDLPEDNPNTRADNLYNGIYIAPDTSSGYSAFLSRQSSQADQELFNTTGVVYYDDAQSSYIITSRAKAENPANIGEIFTLNNDACITRGEGELNFGEDLGRMNMQTYGTLEHDLQTDLMESEMTVRLDFHFSEAILLALAESLNAYTSAGGTDINNDSYNFMTERLLSEKDYGKFWGEVESSGMPEKLPKELSSTFIFNNLKMNWDPELNSFVSDGPIAISSILRMPVNKAVKGYFEIQRKRKGDEITLYFEGKGGDYYFFQYKRNVMIFYSTDDALMDILRQTDMKFRSLSKDGKLPPFIYNQGSKGKVRRFLSRFEEL